MSLKRTSPNLTQPSTGTVGLGDSYQNRFEEIIEQKTIPSQQYFDKIDNNTPIYRLFDTTVKRFHSVKESARTIVSIMQLVSLSKRARSKAFRSASIKEIAIYKNILSLFENEKLSELFYHPSKNDKPNKRKRRIERVKAILLEVIGVILYYLDLHDMAFGRRGNKNELIYHDYNCIIEKTGLRKERVQRCMWFLQKIGLVDVKKINQTLDDGYIITKEVRITLSETFFDLLGLSDELAKDRARASNKYKEKESKLVHKKAKEEKQKASTNKKTKTNIKPSNFSGHEGNTRVQLEYYNKLISRGLSIKDAIAALKRNFPPN